MKELLIILLISICYSCKEYDREIDEKFRKHIDMYSPGDTLYYESNLKDLDTFKIEKIDSTFMDGSILYPSSKTVEVEIKHLPNNKWITGQSVGENGEPLVYNELLFHVRKDLNSNKYQCGIWYRDLYSAIDVNKKIDTLIRRTNNKFLDNESVVEIYWSRDNGMIGYRKKDGQVYHRK